MTDRDPALIQHNDNEPTPQDLFQLRKSAEGLINLIYPSVDEVELLRQQRLEYRGFTYSTADKFLDSLDGRAGRFFAFPRSKDGGEEHTYTLERGHWHFSDEMLAEALTGEESRGHKGVMIVFAFLREDEQSRSSKYVILPDEYPAYQREAVTTQDPKTEKFSNDFGEITFLTREEVLALTFDIQNDFGVAYQYLLDHPDAVLFGKE